VKTRAGRDGDHYVLNGSKTFISNGLHAGLVGVVAKTDATKGAKGISIVMVETGGQAGYRVLGLRLPGHGALPSGLLSVTWEDLAAAARLGMAHLASVMGGKPIHIIGYSMGAALAVDYSLNARAGTPLPPPASLLLISPAVGLARIADLTHWVERLGRLPGLGRLAWTAIMPEFDPFRYNSFTANAWTGSTNTAGARRTWSRPDEGRKVTSPQRSPGSTDLATTALPLTRSRRVWTKT